MGWKKPKWVKNIQKGAQGVVNTVANTVTDILAPDTANRKPTVKIQGPNPLEQERELKKPMKDFGPTPGEAKAFENLQPIAYVPVLDDKRDIPVIDNIRKVLASGGSGVTPIPAGGEEPIIVPKGGTTNPDMVAGPIDQARLARVRATLEKAGTAVKEKAVEAGKAVRDTFREGTDAMDVKVFRSRFRNEASPVDVEAYRRAQAAGDKKEMDRLTTLMESRQKRGGK